MRQVGVLDSAHVLSVSDFSTKKTLLLQGIGWGYLPEHLVKAELKAGILKILPLQKLHIPISTGLRQRENRKKLDKEVGLS